MSLEPHRKPSWRRPFGDDIAASVAPAAPPPDVIVVDGDGEALRVWRALFKEQGLVLEDFQTAEELLAKYTMPPAPVVIIDLEIATVGGEELSEVLKARNYEGRIIGTSSALGMGVRGECIERGMDDFMPKPCAFDLQRTSKPRTLDPDEFD